MTQFGSLVEWWLPNMMILNSNAYSPLTHESHTMFVRVPAEVTVMVPALSVNLLLLSRTAHPAVLINTNAWHRYGELKSSVFKRVLDATNFATRLRSRRVGSERLFTPRNPL